MGLLTIYSTVDNVCYQIVINHDDTSSEVIKYLDESSLKFENFMGSNLEIKQERALKHREEMASGFGGNDVIYKFTTGCKIAALALVNHLRREFGCQLTIVTSLPADAGVLYVLNHSTQWRASIPFLSAD